MDHGSVVEKESHVVGIFSFLLSLFHHRLLILGLIVLQHKHLLKIHGCSYALIILWLLLIFWFLIRLLHSLDVKELEIDNFKAVLIRFGLHAELGESDVQISVLAWMILGQLNSLS